jgi:NADP-dependent 3-hydroxy acid dehydrogenase YdfG
MTDTLAGSVALVTGASSGIGAATAKSLAALGARVALVARREDRLEEVAHEIERARGTALSITTDITDLGQATAAVDRAAQHFGRLDIVINNAGLMLLGDFQDSPIDEWDRMIDVNIRGHLYVARAALPHLLAAVQSGDRGVADLINVSSQSGRVSTAGSAVYNATKWAVAGFSDSLRKEVGKKRVRVSLVEPGAVSTELASHTRPEVFTVPNPDFVGYDFLEAEHIARTIVFMAASPFPMAVHEVLVRPTEQLP